jgi:hypothetical protein
LAIDIDARASRKSSNFWNESFFCGNHEASVAGNTCVEVTRGS